jgi:hypothetical protein
LHILLVKIWILHTSNGLTRSRDHIAEKWKEGDTWYIVAECFLLLCGKQNLEGINLRLVEVSKNSTEDTEE